MEHGHEGNVSYLSYLPVDTSTLVCWHGGQINDKVANLAVEVVLVGVPVGSIRLIGIRVNDSHALEARVCLDSRKVDSISDELSVIVLNDWTLDEICSRRKVYNRRSQRR